MLKIAVLPPIPRAKVMMTVVVKNGARISDRHASLTSDIIWILTHRADSQPQRSFSSVAQVFRPATHQRTSR